MLKRITATLLHSSAGHRMISLKWRAIALTSLLLLSLASLFTFIGHNNLTRQLSRMQSVTYARQVSEIEQALARSSDNLRQLASLTAASTALGEAVRAENTEAIRAALQSQWPTMQLDAGIDEVRVFDSDNQPLAAWGQAQADDSVLLLRQWLARVKESEAPLKQLLCTDDCRQYVLVPILVDGTSVGQVMVSRSLADVIHYAQSSLGSDIALLVKDGDKQVTQSSGHYFPTWHVTLAALTHQQTSLPILETAIAKVDLASFLHHPLRLDIQDRHFEMRGIALDEADVSSGRGYFVLITDITEQIDTIAQNTKTILLVALGGWLAAEIMLLVILWTPMARLRRLADILPELAEGRFDAVRRQIVPLPQSRFTDEIGVLDRTTLELTDQLEALEGEVHARGEQLTARLKELARERDFIKGLLDTARVFILTQDSHGRIVQLNHYAQAVVGLPEHKLLGRAFTDIFMSGQNTDEGALDWTSQQEGRVLTQANEQRFIAWSHAPLPDDTQDAQALISVGLDITERKEAEERLAWLAHRDPLTELYNRRFFQLSLEQAIYPDADGAVLYLDLDQFKEVNELSGHHSGDQLLRLVAEALENELKDEALIARLGGDEFAVLLKNASGEKAIGVAMRIGQALEEISFSVNGRRHPAVASIGIAQYPAHGDNPVDLMASADLAMYKAKENSTQRWHLLSAVSHTKEELQQRVYWIDCIRLALQENRFELMVQPILCLEDHSIKHYEVLVRLKNEEGHLVAPSLFIPVAERSGQIIEIDRWVLRASLQLLRSVQDEGICLAVNLSGHSLHDAGLEHFLAQEFAASGADPHHLILEVTETAAVTDFATARGVMQGIRNLGCQTALDDFGVGFSSFHYLGQLPADYIKIDGSFIQNLLTSHEDRLIVKAIAEIAAGFGKQTIAEFVDQAAILPILREYGITYAQGYYLGRPAPANTILKR
ncbi:bifunctional diguanylate cyclase/phosphodiesterase [Phytohalomonas tamaricis]|uniref:bifunctional diguanylate cyclase/phosphodiesterase n=1 Tax=Phytohalomonas tamaricis TaxID=2081032 RepID=UPI0021D428D7|nr:EAL domain-containing protein [Phytohalomonas tamaricis]